MHIKIFLLICMLLVFGFAISAFAEPFAVTGVSASVEPSVYTGPCPKTFVFTGVITANGPGMVTYRWEHSPNTGKQETITSPGAGSQKVTHEYISSHNDYLALVIDKPNTHYNGKFLYSLADFKVTCTTKQEIIATLKAIPDSYSGKCPTTINFEGVITVKKITKPIHYRFTRSDGASSPTKTLTFDKDGSKKVTTTWTLGDPIKLPTYDGWVAIEIISPQKAKSYEAKFKIQCEKPKVKEKEKVGPIKTKPQQMERKPMR